jgi:hypothetical protein
MGFLAMQELPYSRLMEREADEVGLCLMARACFDPSEVRDGTFWCSLLLSHSSCLCVLHLCNRLQRIMPP